MIFDTKTVIGGIFLLILVYLLVFNGEKTTAVLNAASQALTSETLTLQGRSTTSS